MYFDSTQYAGVSQKKIKKSALLFSLSLGKSVRINVPFMMSPRPWWFHCCYPEQAAEQLLQLPTI